jgi:hypothetical protein
MMETFVCRSLLTTDCCGFLILVSRVNLEMAMNNYLNLVTAMNQMEGWFDLYFELNEVVKAAKNSAKKSKDVTPLVAAN